MTTREIVTQPLRGKPRRSQWHLAGRIPRVIVLVAFALFYGTPLLWLLLAPTKTRSDLSDSAPLSFGSFANVGAAWQNLLTFNNGIITTWTLNSILYSVVGTLFILAIAVPAGYVLAAAAFRGRKLILITTLLTMIIPSTALVLPLFLELATLRMLNTPWAVILPGAFYPFGVYLSFLYFADNLPRNLLDAARIDGAGEFRVFFSVALPLARPLIGLVGFFGFVHMWNNFFLPYVTLTDSRLYPLQTGFAALLSASPALNPGRGATTLPIHEPEAALAALITVLPILLVFLFAQRFLVAGQMAGSEKG